MINKRHDGKFYDRSREGEYREKCISANEIKTKECNKCRKVLPATTENFYKKKDAKNGLAGICKKCRKDDYLEKNNLKTNKIEEKETEILSEKSIYDWVKSLPKNKRSLLDPLKISAKIREELFGK